MPSEPAADTPIGRRGAYAKGIARRAEILDRAIEVFRERGPAGTSLRSIAEALGVSHAALLHYFDSRDQLLVAVYEHHERTRGERPPTGLPGGAAGTVRSWSAENAFVPGLVELYTSLLSNAVSPDAPVAREFITARFERVRTVAAEQVRDDQAAGIIRSDVDADDIAALIISVSDGLQVQWLLDPRIAMDKTLETFGALLRP